MSYPTQNWVQHDLTEPVIVRSHFRVSWDALCQPSAIHTHKTEQLTYSRSIVHIQLREVYSDLGIQLKAT